MNKLVLLALMPLLIANVGLCQTEGDIFVVIIGVFLVFGILIAGGVVFLMMRKKKPAGGKISRKAANFARLVRSLCADSGIRLELQLAATKMIARDFVDAPGKDIQQFFFYTPEQAKAYLKRAGFADLDADIFFNILQSSKDEFNFL